MEYPNIGVRQMYWRYYCQSRKRGYSFNLTKEQVISLVTNKHCGYCGRKPYQTALGYLVLGIDRINNDIGYEFNNCIPCCKSCNYKKGTGSINRLFKILAHG